jgi:DNA-binding transcriptional ArsR family regulator
VVRAGAPAVEDVFGVLGHPTRRALLRRLAGGECSVGDLAHDQVVTRSAVSQHLRLMLQVGVVTERRDGRQRRYRLQPAAFEEVRDFLAELDLFWSERLAVLGDLLGTSELEE